MTAPGTAPAPPPGPPALPLSPPMVHPRPRPMIRAGLALPLLVALLALLGTMLAAAPAHADGLRATGRVRTARPGPAVAIALGSGYGFTESVLDADDAHHRVGGLAAVAIRALPWLELGGEVRGRYDRHTGAMPDDGFVGDPRLWLAASRALGGERWLALRLGVWLPGSDVPSIEPDAVTVDASAALTTGGPAARVTATAGFRLDRSSRSVDAARLSPADRLGLGLSEASAVLLGIGASRSRGAWELVGEASWDLLVGDGAPAPHESPIRLGAGARRTLDESLTLEAMLEVAASARPAIDEPLVAIEPRLAATIGLSWRPRPPVRAAPVVTPEVTTPVEPPPPPPPPRHGDVRGRVVDADGAPLPGATVRLGARAATTGDDGTFTLAEVAPGSVDVLIERPGHEPTRRTLTITAGGEVQLEVALVRVRPPSQIRGVVRGFDGKGLAATVRLEPAGLEVTADADGSFQVDVPPGRYTVVVTLAGFEGQRRPVEVEDEGVAVLNIELRRARR